MSFASLGANRGITLNTGGVLTATTNCTLNGPVAGTGGLKIGVVGDTMSNYIIMKVANSYTGGTDIANGNLFITDDNQLGAVPVTLDPANVTIRNNNIFKFQTANVNMDANRGITMVDNATIISGATTSGNHTINGPITGTGNIRYRKHHGLPQPTEPSTSKAAAPTTPEPRSSSWGPSRRVSTTRCPRLRH